MDDLNSKLEKYFELTAKALKKVKIQENLDTSAKKSAEEILDLAKLSPELMIIGGGEIYKQILPYVDRIYLTAVDVELEGDTFFPELEEINWNKTLLLEHSQDEKHAFAFQIFRLDCIK